MTKKYWWKRLTNEGLLIEPKYYGPYYNEFKLNDGPFDIMILGLLEQILF
jgi:hypothetical protein